MARAEYDVYGARADVSVIRTIHDWMRPLSLRVLEDQLANPYDYEAFGDQESVEAWKNEVRSLIEDGGRAPAVYGTVVGSNGIEYEWDLDTDPDGRLLDSAARIDISISTGDFLVELESRLGSIQVKVQAPTSDIDAFNLKVQEALQDTVAPERLVQETIMHTPEPMKVFIGHGGDRKWEVVRDYTRAAGYRVEAFETSPRAGEMTLAVVERMISEASVAIVVMTGADRLENGQVLARQNVVHELGFAQGRLGVNNTIVLLEEGVAEFSNIAGLTQVRFAIGEAHTTKEHVLASLANKAREAGFKAHDSF